MNIVGYDSASYTEGLGIRVAVWVSGCPHHCRGCFNAHYFDPKKGTPFSEKHLDKILQDLDNSYIDGISLLGGEPLAPYNIEGMYSIICAIRERFGNTKTIWVYTGYLFEEVPDYIKDSVDYIMDGKYEKDNPTKKPFRGSDNQCLYVKKDGIWHKVD